MYEKICIYMYILLNNMKDLKGDKREEKQSFVSINYNQWKLGGV